MNRRAESRITNCDVLTKKGPITLKVYREDSTSEVIPNFKASDLYLGEWREVVKAYIPQSEQDPFDKLNDLANKKRKHVDDIHDYFKANKRLKSSVQYKYHLPGIVLNEHVLGPGLDDHAKTFSSLLLAEVDKRNLNPLKQMRAIEQLRQLFVYSNRGRLLGSVLEPFKVSSASALQVLKRFRSIFTSVYAAVQKLKNAFAKSFSSAWLTILSWTMSISLTEVEMKCFIFRRFTRREKDMLYVKKNKVDLLGKVTSKVGIEAQQLFLKDCT
ncbi:hypothetical protein Tco_0837114 [Tanacetum coccineum]